MLDLEELKLYLRIDGDEENALITSLIGTAEEICEQILRQPLSEFDPIPLTVKQAMLFCVANMYEKREGVANYNKSNGGIEEIIHVMKMMLNTYRKEVW